MSKIFVVIALCLLVTLSALTMYSIVEMANMYNRSIDRWFDDFD